ncbi:unnamed protein product [Polarella glacialis]|uniref:Uncharacterized protein n=1 Tax=Polarella glacialis TaxID=89957 RepID=A0A813DE25_POLGL|nr:unnamed protein product [Polarella glacialis]
MIVVDMMPDIYKESKKDHMDNSEAEEKYPKADNTLVDAKVILNIGQVRGFELIHAVMEGTVMEEDEPMDEVFSVVVGMKRYVAASDGVFSGRARPGGGEARTGDQIMGEGNGVESFFGRGGSGGRAYRHVIYLRTPRKVGEDQAMLKNRNAGKTGASHSEADVGIGVRRWPGGADGLCGGAAGEVSYEKKTEVPAVRHQGRSQCRADGPGKGGGGAGWYLGVRPGVICSSAGIGEEGDGRCSRCLMRLDRRSLSGVSGSEGLGAAAADVERRILRG